MSDYRETLLTEGEAVMNPVENQQLYPNNSLPYQLNIEGLNVGYVLRVGCQHIAVQDKEQLKKLICDYIDNPEEVVKKYQNRTLF